MCTWRPGKRPDCTAASLVLDADALNVIAAADAAHVQLDRLQAAASLAARYRCTIVLKGSGTVIAAPLALPRINPTGNGRLATAGTGDVLAGWMAGRWSAQPQAQAQAVVCCAVWEHGWAAQADKAMNHAPMVASALIDGLSRLDPA
jgi:ADP-dependent NAD(P)H-hydrate dehydratase / NAD(P)H-hydrate epimerase